MTVSAYQVDNVIKAYNKQQKTKLRADIALDSGRNRNADIVTLSGAAEPGKDIFSKISYNILDILTKNKK